MNDDLGDRMKLYENAECERKFLPLLPIVARVDGRAFHSFTRGMKRPFDDMFRSLMESTAFSLMQETNASFAYTQSDEITLAWHSTSIKSQVWFDGRICKMTSQLAAHATLAFNNNLRTWNLDYATRLPTFDSRVWTVPNRTEAANVFVWREQDATKNSITMAAEEHYSHRELHGKNGKQKQEMLFVKGINWNDYPTRFKRGVYFQKHTVTRPFTTEELDLLPEKHEARKNPGLLVERQQIRWLDLPIITTIANREGVIFDGDDPVVASQIERETK
jgi:tRNA(His) 5'-end guanylyltransferase